MRPLTKFISFLVLSLACGSAFASDGTETTDASPGAPTVPLPAVDGINGKLSIEKDVTGHDLVGGTGTITIPLGHQFGFQLNGQIAKVGQSDFEIPIHAAAAHLFHLGGEWTFGGHRGSATSMFVESSVIENGNASALLGLRLYIGQNEKSLIRRHREDDPEDELESWATGSGLTLWWLKLPEFDFGLTDLKNILDIDYCQRHRAKCAAFANR